MKTDPKTEAPQKPKTGPPPKTEAPQKAKAGPSRKTVGLTLGSVALVCVAAVTVVYLLRSQDEIQPEEIPLANGRVITAENVHEIEAQVQETVARGMFQTHMNTVWNFPDASSPSSDAVMGNSVNNVFPFYFTVSVPDIGVVFTSGLMPVGTVISEIVLDEELEAGTYDATVRINMFDDDGEPVESNMGFRVTLNIRS